MHPSPRVAPSRGAQFFASIILLLAWAGARPVQAALDPDPFWSYGGTSGAQLGRSISTAGDVDNDGCSDLLIGLPGWSNGETGEGRVLLVRGSKTGMVPPGGWTVESNQADAGLGTNVSTAGDVNGDGYDDVLVAAPYYEHGNVSEGKVWCYLGGPSGLAATANWTKEGTSDNARFGGALCAAGDVNGDGYDDVVVASPDFGVSQPGEGSIYLYLGGPSGLSTSTAWSKEGNQTGAHLGYSLAPAGDVNADGYDDVIIGAPSYNNATDDSGAAWIYLGGPTGLASSANFFVEGGTNWHFGWTVATIGDSNGDGYSDVFISGGTGNPMYVYVYQGSASGMDDAVDHIYSDTGNSSFGLAMFTAGDTNGDGYADAVVGDRTQDSGNTANGPEGAVYLFESMGSFGLSPAATTTIYGEEDVSSLSFFGARVTTAGDVNGDGYGDVVVSDYNYGVGQAGAVWIYLGRPTREPGNDDWTEEADQAGAHFGNALATGDWNADGYSDLAVGAWFQDNPTDDEGVLYVYHGGRGGLSTTIASARDCDQANALFGRSVANAGDTDGDGFEDLLVGAPNWDGGETNEGAVWLYRGGATGISSYPSIRLERDQAGAWVGWAVASAGDVNADGYSDVLLGVPRYESGALTNEGAAFLYLGSADGIHQTPDWAYYGGEAGAELGYSVASAGDVNLDGYSDVIIGAPNAESGQSDEGLAFVFHGGPTGLSASPNRILQANQANASFGAVVSSAGDVNADGRSDVLVGAPAWTNPNSAEGLVRVYHGGASGVSSSYSWTGEGGTAGFRFGESACAAGDVDNDGYGDILIGAPYYGFGTADEGRAVIYHGSAGGVLSSTDWEVEGDQAGCKLSDGLAGGGDFNGDGFSDVALGAPYYTNGHSAEGRVIVYLGNEKGLDRPARQMRSNGLVNVALHGNSDTSDGIVLKGLGRTPMGRGRVRTEWQMWWQGDLNAQPIQRASSDQDTGAPVSGPGSRAWVSTSVTGLDDGHTYEWRLRFRSDSPYFPWTPWLKLPGNAQSEVDFRTPTATSDAPDLVLAGSDGPAFVQVGPNPCRGSASLHFVLPSAARARVTLHDVTGREVAHLIDAELDAGTHDLTWSGRTQAGAPAPAGIYFARLEAGGRVCTERIVRLQ